ncbi:hypothetical protein TWF569_001814 [Orbilia oligospora]|uniref:VPS9 domain-containing protein n=1 Tax=Orbilia oligospora TaxID=2813651 RepID=A0A7C8N492_ORBOL|nr:hypothetical protein TWF706_002093 [Orbilia oligospora]KAF3084876.1 hypothetical protein TWF102_011820 [Orbilia oligospora]KAF3091606.1 hypothetical protein TWF103_011608 [Orbilia oligospora]KAF3123061.1 hypothetical protein TWF569_001814 [Orbilia oligospora]KAF3129092.1 hypothetical protein TWF594_011108 [Orbilia oligospora]
MASSLQAQQSLETESTSPRPTKTLGSVRSFTRLESQSPPTRSRSATLNSTIGPGVSSSFGAFSESNFTYDSVDYVEGSHLTGSGDPDDRMRDPVDESLPQLELPVEVIEMTDSFIESLSAKIHPAPVSIDLLSTMFQDFYETMTTPISAHVSKLFSSHDSQASDQPLVSMSEIAQRKKDRKRRETLQVALQEMVEKRVTEAVFDRIWRHYGTEDEARDEALRSKTMALAVVGIGLKELGLEDNINVMDLRPVCEALRDLNTTKCPRDKLRLLKRAHKAIVDTLTSVVPSTSSSADHILPILIYSLIISPPSVHIVSNLLYIQRFRYHRSIDGEAAYCLTNLEAAVSFLETVDMGTLAADESRVTASVELEPDRISSTSLLPYAEHTGNRPLAVIAPAITDTSPANAPPRSEARAQKEAPVVPSMTGATRRMTYLTPVEFATSAATSAVNTADQSLKTIGNSLENSYRFLFGKLSDKRTDLPKTLEDVRKLVGTPVQDLEPPRDADIYRHPYSEGLKTVGSHSGDGLVTSVRQVETSDTSNNTREATVKVPQDHEIITGTPLSIIEPSASQGAAYTPVAESVRNLGSHLGRFAGNINVIRSFSRGQMPKTPPPGSSGTGFDSINSSSGAPQDKTVTKIDPPIARFLDTEVADLRISDVDLLLQDYRRLAAALKSAGAF